MSKQELLQKGLTPKMEMLTIQQQLIEFLLSPLMRMGNEAGRER
jgi:hypothetical protein